MKNINKFKNLKNKVMKNFMIKDQLNYKLIQIG